MSGVSQATWYSAKKPFRGSWRSISNYSALQEGQRAQLSGIDLLSCYSQCNPAQALHCNHKNTKLFKVRHEGCEKFYWLKAIDLTNEEYSKEIIERHRLTLEEIDCQQVVRYYKIIYDHSEVDDSHSFLLVLMEYVEAYSGVYKGQTESYLTLQKYIEARRNRSWIYDPNGEGQEKRKWECLNVGMIIQILLGLYSIHKHRLHHGSLTPQNIFVTKDMRIKVSGLSSLSEIGSRKGSQDIDYSGLQRDLSSLRQIMADLFCKEEYQGEEQKGEELIIVQPQLRELRLINQLLLPFSGLPLGQCQQWFTEGHPKGLYEASSRFFDSVIELHRQGLVLPHLSQADVARLRELPLEYRGLFESARKLKSKRDHFVERLQLQTLNPLSINIEKQKQMLQKMIEGLEVLTEETEGLITKNFSGFYSQQLVHLEKQKATLFKIYYAHHGLNLADG